MIELLQSVWVQAGAVGILFCGLGVLLREERKERRTLQSLLMDTMQKNAESIVLIVERDIASREELANELRALSKAIRDV